MRVGVWAFIGLVACVTAQEEDSLTGQIAGWTAGRGTIQAVLPASPERASVRARQGQVNEQGRFSFDLPSASNLAEVAYREAFADVMCPEGERELNQVAPFNWLPVAALRVTLDAQDDATHMISLTSASDLAGDLDLNEVRVMWLYASSAASVEGSCYQRNGVTERYSLRLRSGWNRVYFIATRMNGTQVGEYKMTTTQPDAELQWRYR